MSFSKKSLPFQEFQDKPETTAFLRNLGTAFASKAFDPVYSNITGATKAYGLYQMADGICFVFYRFEGSLTFLNNTTIRLPVPYFKGGVFNSASFFGQNPQTAGNIRQFASVAQNIVIPTGFTDGGPYVINGFYLTDN